MCLNALKLAGPEKFFAYEAKNNNLIARICAEYRNRLKIPFSLKEAVISIT